MRRHLRFANTTAETMFGEFQNTNFQGDNFTWETFPDLVGRIVKANLIMGYARKPADWEEIKKEAQQIAIDRARALVEAAESLPTRTPSPRFAPRP